jgi:hypothetical protein
MVKPIPDKVKDTLKELSSAQALVLRTYIGTLRADMKELEEQVRIADPDPNAAHAHYHGDEKCFADHGVAETDHKSDGDAHEHNHGETCTADHDHSSHGDHKEHKHEHKEHGHKEHKHEHPEKKSHDDEHKHEHHEKKSHDHEDKHEHHEKRSHDQHKHEHHEKKSHDQEHKHEHDDDDIPAWKKKALEAGAGDPMAAPFGGNWNSESMVDAQKDKMEE